MPSKNFLKKLFYYTLTLLLSIFFGCGPSLENGQIMPGLQNIDGGGTPPLIDNNLPINNQKGPKGKKKNNPDEQKKNEQVIRLGYGSPIKFSNELTLENIEKIGSYRAEEILESYRKNPNHQCFKNKKIVKAIAEKCFDKFNYQTFDEIKPFSAKIPSDTPEDIKYVNTIKDYLSLFSKDKLDKFNDNEKNKILNIKNYPCKIRTKFYKLLSNFNDNKHDLFTDLNNEEECSSPGALANLYSVIADQAARAEDNFTHEVYKKGLEKKLFDINNEITTKKCEKTNALLATIVRTSKSTTSFLESAVRNYIDDPFMICDMPVSFSILKEHENNIKIKKSNLVNLKNKIKDKLNSKKNNYNYFLDIYKIMEKQILYPKYSLNGLQSNKPKFEAISNSEKNLLNSNAHDSFENFIQLNDSISKDSVNVFLKNVYESLFSNFGKKTVNWFKNQSEYDKNSKLFIKLLKNVLSKDLLICPQFCSSDYKNFLDYIFYDEVLRNEDPKIKSQYYNLNKQIMTLISKHSSKKFREEMLESQKGRLKAHIKYMGLYIANIKAFSDITNKVEQVE